MLSKVSARGSSLLVCLALTPVVLGCVLGCADEALKGPAALDGGLDASVDDGALGPEDAGVPGSDGSDDASEPPAPELLFGWQRTPTNTGLAGVGLTCEGLARYTGGAKIPSGTRISERRIETTLDLSAGNITIERSCIKPQTIGRGMPVVTTTDFNNCSDDGCQITPAMVTIRDSEIDGSSIESENIAYACAFSGVGTLERNYMHDVGSGICFFGTSLTLDAVADGNYVRGLRAFGNPATTGSHNESFTIRDFDTRANPGRRMRIENNRLECKSGNDSGALFIQTYAGDIDQVLIQGNLLEDGGYQLVMEAGFGHVYGRNMRAINNRFNGKGYGPGYVDGKGLSYSFGTWQDNYIDDPTQPDHKGRLVAPL